MVLGGGVAVTRKNDMKLHLIFIAINITIIPSFRMQCHIERKGNDTSPYN